MSCGHRNENTTQRNNKMKRNYHLLTYNPWTNWKSVSPETSEQTADRKRREAEAVKKYEEKYGKSPFKSLRYPHLQPSKEF
jgi:hypothetical protein